MVLVVHVKNIGALRKKISTLFEQFKHHLPMHWRDVCHIQLPPHMLALVLKRQQRNIKCIIIKTMDRTRMRNARRCGYETIMYTSNLYQNI